ncbi:ATP-binding protein [Bifidobacterium sp. MA2]|uniref:ATP-binding protein n=1 Tax=Bifidobacterium santillanense TaxID=2809028 RepID=A0ABS5USX7_9BIFI|nr:ATP-binding protein [Bifidobacterium santillanense]MBT1173809.1 ATP-binding protein [Bifidobacterium santillanense]
MNDTTAPAADPLFAGAMSALDRASADDGADVNAEARRGLEVLDALRYGDVTPAGMRRIAFDPLPWTAADEIERAAPGRPNMFERLLLAWNEGDGPIDIAIRRRGDGLHLMIGGLLRDDLVDKARMVLAPTCALRRIAPDMAPPRNPRCSRGVVFRMQEPGGATAPDAGDGDATDGFPLIERLQTVPGDWTLVLRCTPTRDVMRSRLAWELGVIGDESSRRLSRSVRTDSTVTATVTSDPWRRVHDWAAAYRRWMNEARARGMWSVRTVAMSDDGDAVLRLTDALQGAARASDGTAYETFSAPATDDDRAPEAESLMTAREIGILLTPPSCGMPGLSVRTPLPASRRRPEGRGPTGGDIRLGVFRGTSMRAGIPVADLQGHALICGGAGSGKSTTLRRVLAEAWNRHRIPFLLIDPLKDEYTPIVSRFDGGLHVVHGSQLRMNLMAPWPGTGMGDHLMKVTEAIRGAFAFPNPTPFVVTQLFRRVAERCGEGTRAVPSLFDVRGMADAFVRGLGYDPEVESNIRAAIDLRLDMLLAPDMAPRFCWPDSSMITDLLDRPAVICLDDIPDEETRSFLVLLLCQAVWAHARERGLSDEARHLFVLEEAHRVMPQMGDDVDDDPEHGSAKRSASRMLATMMAEIRGFGESVIVVDQSPSRIARDAVRNTGLKIAHRLMETTDRRLMADMIGLPESSSRTLLELAPGTCLVSSRFEPSPQAVSIIAMPEADDRMHDGAPDDGPVAAARRTPAAGTGTNTAPTTAWPCCAGDPAAHFGAWARAERAAGPMALFLGAALWGDPDAGLIRDVESRLSRVMDGRRDAIDCLAWAGLRHLLDGGDVVPGHAGEMGDHAFRVWLRCRRRIGSTAADGGMNDDAADALARIASRFETDDALRDGIADALLAEDPRDGLRQLNLPMWRELLPDMRAYLRRHRTQLRNLIGSTATDRLLTTLVRRAVRRADLSEAAADALLIALEDVPAVRSSTTHEPPAVNAPANDEEGGTDGTPL